ncbi:MAG: xylan 1,4-beta-xylosidase [Micromonosporaceae bacterium]|nr:xylan 1,4-beta-xylosidase [Micromonosporaceae bacterium]
MTDARVDWERRIYRRSTQTADADQRLALPAPTGVRATSGVGHVALQWDPVPGAAGYLVQRSADGGEPEILTHGGSDVPAVPGCRFADTGLRDGVRYRYRIGAVAGAEHPAWAWSAPVESSTGTGAPGPVQVAVDASTVEGQTARVWRMVGSERLSQLLLDGAQQWIADEFADALRRARQDLGVTHVRAHAILHDDNQVVRRDPAGALQLDFTRIDAIYDRLLEIGLRPVVELSYMPAALARDPEQTVFDYQAIVSPPADWGQWRELVCSLVTHLVERYGVAEVAGWGFEVWNEPNLEVFWTGTRDEYLRLYDEAARAVKAVDERLPVGGPATAAGEWLEALAEHAAGTGAPLDFVTTHTYGNLPLDVRPSLRRHDLGPVPVWWTEWGVGSTHYGPVHDGAFGAPFVLSGLSDVQGRLDALAYWVISDHFEELGRPPRLFHNGFGLLTVGNLGKPRYWALHLAAHQGEQVLGSRVTGDGAGVLVRAWATRHQDGTVDVLVWNGTINAALLHGDPQLDRDVALSVTGLGDGVRRAITIARVDAEHSNIALLCPSDLDWPDEALWQKLRAADRLHEEPLPEATLPEATGDTTTVHFRLPMPGVVRVRLQLLPGKE